MQIASSQQMLQHIDTGGSLSVTGQGQLSTQSGISRFFQSIGDAFRNLSASGRATIDSRNLQLATAMAEQVRRDNPLPNLAAGPLPGAAQPVTRMERDVMLARLEISKELKNFAPQDRAQVKAALVKTLTDRVQRSDTTIASIKADVQQQVKYHQNTIAARGHIEAKLHLFAPEDQEQVRAAMIKNFDNKLDIIRDITPKGIKNVIEIDVKAQQGNIQARGIIAEQVQHLPVENQVALKVALSGIMDTIIGKNPHMTPDEIRQEVATVLQEMEQNPTLLQTLHGLGRQPSEEQLAQFSDRVKHDFSLEFLKPAQQEQINNGVHQSYILDARRDSIASVNNQPLDREDIVGQLTNLLPNPALSGFVSMLCSQAGGEGAITVLLMLQQSSWGLPAAGEMGGMIGVDAPHHKYSINVNEDSVEINLNLDVAYTLTAFNDLSLETAKVVATPHYDVNFSIPLNQNFVAGQVPEFNINMTMRP